MIAHLFELSGIDQILAPFHDIVQVTTNNDNNNTDARSSDKNNSSNDNDTTDDDDDEASKLLVKEEEGEEEEEKSDFWEFVAPRCRPSPSSTSAASTTTSTSSEGHAVTTPTTTTLTNNNNVAAHAKGIAVEQRLLVKCQYCHKMTPVETTNADEADSPRIASSAAAAATLYPTTPHSSNIVPTNHDNSNNDNNDDDDDDEEEVQIMMEKSILHQRVLQAAHQTALTSSGPTFLWEEKHNLFELCVARPSSNSTKSTPAAKQSKHVKKLKKLLTNKSPHLLLARSANMGTSLGLPDGFTILHAACYVGNVEVVEYLLEHHVETSSSSSCGGADGDGTESSLGEDGNGGASDENRAQEKDGGNADEVKDREDHVSVATEVSSVAAMPKIDLNEVDMQGKTALHIAAERGHTEVILLLKTAYDGKINKQQEQKVLVTGECDENEKSSSSSSSATTTPSTTRTPKTPKSCNHVLNSASSHRANNANPSLLSLRSPLLLQSLSSSSTSTTPTFAGPRAPVDLSGRTPLGYAATSPVPKARQNRSALEKVLYVPGDRSIVGHGGRAERTPPRARCGPSAAKSRSDLSPMTTTVSASTFGGGGGGGGESASAARRGKQTPPNSSYLSPTPNSGGYLSQYAPPTSSSRRPGSVMSTTSNYATPFQTPSTILEEEGANEVNNLDYSKATTGGLQWGASEMNGWRIDMEDKILVKYEVYGGETPPSPPTSLRTDVKARTEDPISMGLFGVFDGHGDGGFASNFIASNLWDTLQSQPDWALAYHGCNTESYTALLSSIFTQSCHDLDEELRNTKTRPSRDGGSTAIMAVICNRYLYVANVGDSRCILVKKKTATKVDKEKEGEVTKSTSSDKLCWKSSEIEVVPMSDDHKPNLPEERARIESAGLTVQTDYVPSDSDEGQTIAIHRVRKSDTELLGVSRAFGDYDFKSNDQLSALRQAVVCTPDIVIRERMDDEDMYLILACDGIWDVMSNQDVGEFVARRVAELLNENNCGKDSSINSNSSVQGEVLARVGDDLLALCLEKKSRDNMSVLIVAFPAAGIASSLSALANDEKSSANLSSVADVAVRTLAYE